MQHGVFVPPFGELADPSVIGELAERAEGRGWDGFFVWDHVQYREPATHVLDPWIAMAMVASRTRRLRFGPMVTPLARRRPWIVARQVAALDIASGGRFVLGAGLGTDGSGAELSSFGEELDARRRAEMLDEALAVVGGLLSGERFSHDGNHYRVDEARFLPRSVQAHVPIWLAAVYPHRRPLERAARYDGVFVIEVPSPGELAEVRAGLEASRGEAGRGDAGHFDMVVRLPPGTDPAPWADAGATWQLAAIDQFDLTLTEVESLIEEGPPR